MSAKNSAEADAAAQSSPRYLTAASSPIQFAYSSLKNSLKPNLIIPCACYPIIVGCHPFKRAIAPSSAIIPENPLNTFLNFPGFACMLHLTTSRGVTNV